MGAVEKARSGWALKVKSSKEASICQGNVFVRGSLIMPTKGRFRNDNGPRTHELKSLFTWLGLNVVVVCLFIGIGVSNGSEPTTSDLSSLCGPGTVWKEQAEQKHGRCMVDFGQDTRVEFEHGSAPQTERFPNPPEKLPVIDGGTTKASRSCVCGEGTIYDVWSRRCVGETLLEVH